MAPHCRIGEDGGRAILQRLLCLDRLQTVTHSAGVLTGTHIICVQGIVDLHAIGEQGEDYWQKVRSTEKHRSAIMRRLVQTDGCLHKPVCLAAHSRLPRWFPEGRCLVGPG